MEDEQRYETNMVPGNILTIVGTYQMKAKRVKLKSKILMKFFPLIIKPEVSYMTEKAKDDQVK